LSGSGTTSERKFAPVGLAAAGEILIDDNI
jgi:hypothetical protein